MASPKAIPNDWLARYILGELNNGGREAVETLYFQDEDIHRQLLAVEEELFDSYASGELSENRRRQFEQIFRQFPDFESRLAFAQALRAVVKAAPEQKRQYLSRPIIRLAAAAAAVLLFVVLGSFLVHRGNSNDSQATLPMVTFEISPSIRGANQSGAKRAGNVIHLPNYPAIVRLRIPFNQPHTSSYLVVIETPDGEEKLSLPAQSSAENPNIVTTDLRPTSLEPGDYILSLVLENSLEPVAGFSVRITR